jgi:hypothetical protein
MSTQTSPTHLPPDASEYAAYYGRYVSLVPPGDVLAQLQRQLNEATALLADISEEKSLFRYEPGKWSIRELMGHVNDAERVFGYRAMVFSRGDAAPLPSFEQDDYAKASAAALATTPLANLATEFETMRQSLILMLRRLSPDDWLRKGTASGNVVSVRAMAHIMAGHVRHHLNVLQERYLR